MGPACTGRPHSYASLSSPQPSRPPRSSQGRAACGARGRRRGQVIKMPTRGLRGLTAPPRLVGGRHGACEAWLRCPWAVAGPPQHTHLINPRGVAFVPGTAWPARPLVAHAASCARRVASKPGQAPQALRRPPQGRRLLSTLSWPCMPANSAYAQTRPRPVSRPRPRR